MSTPNLDLPVADAGAGKLFISRRLYISGDPQYGVPNLDPVFVKEISIRESGLTLTARDFTVEGAKDAVLQDIR